MFIIIIIIIIIILLFPLSAFYPWSAVCSLHFTPGLQSTVCVLHWPLPYPVSPRLLDWKRDQNRTKNWRRNRDRPSPLAANFLFVCYADVSENNYFHGKLKSSHRYHSSNSKKIRERVDSKAQRLWRRRVMGWKRVSCYGNQMFIAIRRCVFCRTIAYQFNGMCCKFAKIALFTYFV